MLGGIGSAQSVEAISVPLDVPVLDLTTTIERHSGTDRKVQVSTAPGSDGIVRRIEVQSRSSEGAEGWAVFALANTSDQQIDRLLVAPHFRLAGSGLVWPDLGSARIANITRSEGFAPRRQDATEADVFLVTLDPGSVVTFVVELRTAELPQFALWDPNAYKDSVHSYAFFRGIVIGIAGLLALLLTILFIVKSTAMFPGAALFAWSVLAYLSIDFGFLTRVLQIDPGAEQIWRAMTEVLLSTSLVIFLFAYLNLNRWHARYSHVTIGWLVILGLVLGIAAFDPAVAAGIARISLGLIGIVGLGVIIYLALHHYDRAIMILPTWVLLLFWLLGSLLAISGDIVNDIIQPALSGGMVLLVLLIGFTIMQHALAGGSIGHTAQGDVERKALALIGSGDILWDWDIERDRIHTGNAAEDLLGLSRGSLEGPARDWLEILHPSDRSQFSATLDAVIDQRRGRVSQDFRLRSEDGHYRWFRLRGRPVLGSDGEVIRCVGTLVDITDQRLTEERLLHDAVHDNLTGLPNRSLFVDRMETAIRLAQAGAAPLPAMLVIDVDRFKNVNDSLGVTVGDSILLTIARRLARHLKPQDTLARLSGDQFGLLLISETQPDRIASMADHLRKALRAPILFGDREIYLTISIGIAIGQANQTSLDSCLGDAQLAMYHAKRGGGDAVEIFRPSLRQHEPDYLSIESDLQKALERKEIVVYYQPVIDLSSQSVAGFEALVRWKHPQRGLLLPGDFIPVAENTGQITELGSYVLEEAARQLAVWQSNRTDGPGLFVSVNVSSRQLFANDLLAEVKAILARNHIAQGTLKLELTESQIMENPEQASKILTRIKEFGAGLSLDDFGTGHSSLSYLQRFPFDTLKIDQSFVHPSDRGTGPVILRTIIGLAHDLGLDIVAEGAETESDALQLYQMGCQYAQGFLYGQAVEANDATKLLNSADFTPSSQAGQ
ncbi:EAL domain-containing protein [Coralliovum pocilloporae]|uniref:EAL domain-containing protein n=1 Tax=Coralliovum pocilloporae TaxID=3066369 RepID=UPI0033074702